MAGAIMQIDQVRGSSTSYGTAGVARNDIWTGNQVNLVDASGSPANTSWTWALLSVPAGSAAVMHNASS